MSRAARPSVAPLQVRTQPPDNIGLRIWVIGAGPPAGGHADQTTLPSLATALGISARGTAVAALRAPSVDRHHTTLNVPPDEQGLPDA
jgi:hypothetical protein